jgi:hypothetical protein
LVIQLSSKMISNVIRRYILHDTGNRVLVNVSKCTTITMDILKNKLIFKDAANETKVQFTSMNEMCDEYLKIEQALDDLHICKDGKCKCRS